MDKKELVKKFVKKAFCRGNWKCGCDDDNGMYYNESQLADMVEKAMTSNEIKKYLYHDIELWFSFNFYYNSAGNQCGQYNDVELFIDDQYIKTIFTTYDEEYEKNWCK